MTPPRFKAVVLAAGLGTRMKSRLPKVMHRVLGWPMVAFPVERALAAGAEEVAVVVGYGKELVQAELHSRYASLGEGRVTTYEQREMLGTADAVKAALHAFEDYGGAVMILSGDVPNLSEQVIAEVVASHAASDSPVTLVSAHDKSPNAYGRIVRDAAGRCQRIVEFKDASDIERALTEVNVGTYLVDAVFLRDGLARIDSANAAGEFYLTDLIRMAADAGAPANVVVADDINALHGVNDRVQLARATDYARRLRNEAVMRTGVTLIDPASVTIDMDVVLGTDIVIEPGVVLLGQTQIGDGAVLEAGVRLENATVAENGRVCAPAPEVT